MAASVNLPPAKPLPPRPSAAALSRALDYAAGGVALSSDSIELAAEVLHLRAELEAKGSELGNLTAQAMEVTRAWRGVNAAGRALTFAPLRAALDELAEHLGVE